MQVPPLLPRFLLLSGSLPFTADQIKVLSSHKVRMDGKANPPRESRLVSFARHPVPGGAFILGTPRGTVPAAVPRRVRCPALLYTYNDIAIAT